MKDHIYSISIDVPAPPEIVFEHLNDVAKWWPDKFEGESTKLNDEFTFGAGGMHSSTQKIIELVPDKKVVWLTTESLRKADNYEWTGSKLIFELSSNDNMTKLSFTYEGICPENEYGRLAKVCDMVIKENLYHFITTDKTI